ncbi:MAG: DUF2142 domain-containing protein [Actinomycetota bacterium]|nr:DUF2142 domain-containing protein [Actinomycetota bacterium]
MTRLPAPRRASRFLAPPVLLGVLYALLTVVWVLGNPAGAAPDEGTHLLKALAVSAAEPAGDRVPPAPSPPTSKEEAWVRQTSRAVDVPPGLSPVGLHCHAGDPRRSAACQEDIAPSLEPTTGISASGTAHPTTYLLPGFLARLAGTPVTAIQLGRIAGAALSLSLIWTAIALLWDRWAGPAAIVGLTAAVTPMGVFLASSLTPSGPEVAAGVCFFSALLRVTRLQTPPPWVWVALAVSGVILAASRTLGPLWVGIDVAVVVLAHGVRRSWDVLRAAGRRGLWSASAVTAGLALSLGWEVAVQPQGALDPKALRGALRPSLDDLHRVLGEFIGVFGSLDSAMPSFAYVLWWTILAALGLAALWLGRWRDRVVLVLLTAGAVLLTLFVAATNLAQTGFAMQGRYVLPLAVILPLFAGEVVMRRLPEPHRRSLDRLLAALPLVAGGLHAVAWYANARRSAIGIDGTWLFASRSEWAPTSGW